MVVELFVGRGGELGVLAELVAGLGRGVGEAVLVEGEQGIGKSALLRAGLAGAGFRVAWGAADELGQRFPLLLMAQCLGVAGRLAGSAVEGGADGPTGEVGAARSAPVHGRASRGWGASLGGDPVLAGVERVLALVDQWCATSPVVLVAEDLQWADAASLLVLRRLCQAVAQLPLLLAGSFRPGPGQERGLEELRRDVVACGGRVLSLGPLPAGDVAELVRAVVGGPPGRAMAEVIGQAGGNPLYVRELAEGLVRERRVRVAAGLAELVGGPGRVGVPVPLAAAIAERLACLPGDVVEVLRWAAALGPECTVTDLSVVTGRSAGELASVVDMAAAAGVLAEAPAAGGTTERLGFRHGLIRQVLYEGMDRSLRVALHRQAARALADAGEAAERVAAQLLAAQRLAGEEMAREAAEDWVADWLVGAAQGLVYRAPQVAAELLRAALGPMDAGPHRDVLEAGLVRAAFLLMRDEEAVRVGRRLLARAGDPDLAAEIAWLVTYSLSRVGRAAEAATVVADALARPGVGGVQTARLRARQALNMAMSGQVDRAAEVAAEALAGAERADDRFAAGYALQALVAVSFLRRDHDYMLAHLDRALGVIGDDPQTADLRLLLLANKADVLGDLDRRAEAIMTARHALVLAERGGTPRLGMIRLALAFEYFHAGRWDEALAELESALSPPVQDELRPLLHGLLALIAGHRDDRLTVAAHLRAVADQAVHLAHLRVNATYLVLSRALASEQAGQLTEAVGVLTQFLEPGIAEHMPSRHLLLPVLARLALAVGDTATAARAAAAAGHEAEKERLPFKAAAAAHCMGLVAGDPAPVQAAASYYEAAERPFYRATALEDAAVLAADRGDDAAGRQAFAVAVRLYAAVGAEWDIRRADARLRPYGILRGRRLSGWIRPASGWQALTPTEAKIATLIAAGQSNPDIATALLLSRRTVQTHVSHILVKLGGRSRAEITREALQHPAGREHDTG